MKKGENSVADPRDTKSTKQPIGRPIEHPMPEPIPDTPDDVARAIMRNPPKKEWQYLKKSRRKR